MGSPFFFHPRGEMNPPRGKDLPKGKSLVRRRRRPACGGDMADPKSVCLLHQLHGIAQLPQTGYDPARVPPHGMPPMGSPFFFHPRGEMNPPRGKDLPKGKSLVRRRRRPACGGDMADPKSVCLLHQLHGIAQLPQTRYDPARVHHVAGAYR